MSNEEHYKSLIHWAGTRIDYLSARARKCTSKRLIRLHKGNAQALEEEYFDWFAAQHSNKKQNVLFVPYHGNFNQS